tara:strand:+ start:923 stop:1141 length:219 start_codon:yes stop_codon:yes gene_type:complete
MKEDTRNIRSLGWIRANGETLEDKNQADEIYFSTIFTLWARHVAKTGQTYYPPFQKDLIDEFELMEDEDEWS